MLRILSILLVLGGLVVAGLGGAALMEDYMPRAALSAAPAATEAVEAPPPEEAAFETASVDAAPMDSAVPAEPEAMNAPVDHPDAVAKTAGPDAGDADAIAGPESALPEADMGFMFQTQTEEAPAPMSRSMSDAPGVSPAAALPDPKPAFADTLKTVPVAHETPRAAEYKRAFDVTFAIDATGDTTAADAMPGRGLIEEGEAKVSDRVEVRLSGASFNIVAASPPVQSLSPMTENTWRWSVTPLTAGEHNLVFEIFAIDSDAVTPLRTFQDTVTVKVSGINRAIAFADQANPVFVLLGGLGSAIAGLFGAIRFFRK
ncbi:MAG: hypothetical protein ACK4NV_19755 [Pannonibacter sp.]